MQVTSARGEPDKLAIRVHRTGFNEIYLSFRADRVQWEASRCFKCGEHSVCEWTYPLHNHIPRWIELVKTGNIDVAVELSHQTNTLSEITGRVCSQNRLCKGACTIHDERGAVTISNVKHYISDQALTKGQRPDLSRATKVDKRVAIIGAGPAGLVCVDVLTHSGVAMMVYDRYPEIGDLSTSGILSFKLDRSLLAHRREIFSAMGIYFELNCEAGEDVSSDPLLGQYDAVFIGVGTYRPVKAGLPNENAPGVYDALPFLVANTKQVTGLEELPGEPLINTAGLSVVVLGDGDTTMDYARTALRHGVSNVICAYRRDEANMPGSKKEVRNAHEERVNFEFNVQLVALELNKQGHVCGVRFLRTRLGGPDAQGRR